MALGVSEEHLELAASVRGWAERHCGPDVVRAGLEPGGADLYPEMLRPGLASQGLLGLHLSLCFLCFLLGIFRSVLRGGSVVSRPSPPAGAAPQPGHQPPRSGGAAKGGSKDKTAEGQLLNSRATP